MQKQAPTLGRLLTMVLFAFSCFGLLLFLWLSFGGPIPLKPKGYRFEVGFPEATQLAVEADVRVAGVPVGKVRTKRAAGDGNRTLATLEIDRKYAPIAQDAKAALRQKTLLGETYVELTLGTKGKPTVPEGGRLANNRVKPQVELDEILNALDPFTRKAFRTWQQSLAQGLRGRGQDLNDAFGNLPGFIETGGDLLDVLDEQRGALRGLVRNTGVVFGALSEREGQLRNLVVNSDETFSAIADERESFAEIWRIFPTFLDESRATANRLREFSVDTRPLLRELKPAIDDLAPALRDLGRLAPDLRRYFRYFGPLIESSRRSLPATVEIFRGLRPLLAELGPFLSQLNPLLEWIGEHQHTLSDMLANLGVATAAKTQTSTPNALGHYLRQYGPSGTETVAIHRSRLASNRGNAYINPLSLVGPEMTAKKIIASFDCRNTGRGEKDPDPATQTGGSPACREQRAHPWKNQLLRFPHVEGADYRGR